MRPHFIGYFRQEKLFYWVNLGGSWWSFLFMPKTMLEVGWNVILWSMLYWRAGHLDQVILLVWPK